MKFTNHSQYALWSKALTGLLELQQPYSILLCIVGSARPASNNETSVHEVDGFPKQFEGKELVDFIVTKVSLLDSTSEQANV